MFAALSTTAMVARMKRLPHIAAAALALVLTGYAVSQAQAPALPQPPQSAVADRSKGMVAAANPQAVEAGLRVLREGGGAIDAAVAVQTVLGLVEPQSSGLGGGAYMVYYEAKTREVTAYDGRETAPSAAGPDLFSGASGAPLNMGEAIRSGRSTGAPGVVAMLALAHKDHGKRPWNTLFTDAESLARDGFLVGRRLGAYTQPGGRGTAPDVTAYLKGVKTGERHRNPEYAATVRRIASDGPDAFYNGDIAAKIAAKVAAEPNPGRLTAADIAAYRPQKSPALCRPYRAYVVCAPGAPSGGPAVLMALGILENTDVAKHGPADAQGWYLFAESSRLMYADRDKYIGDPAFVSVPMAGLLDAGYLKSRAALIREKSEPRTAGTPPGAVARAADATNEVAGTSHFVIVDRWGNVVSTTTTVESPFGSGRMVGGFVLNNQLTDFSLAPRDASGALVANAPGPLKRPRSSMAPVIVLDRQGNFVAALGSPGGNSIPAYNIKTLVGVLDWKLPVDQAVALPNMIARGPGTSAEVSKLPKAVIDGLAARGIQPRAGGGEDSGLHAIVARGSKLEGAADPRREGIAKAP